MIYVNQSKSNGLFMSIMLHFAHCVKIFLNISGIDYVLFSQALQRYVHLTKNENEIRAC